MDQSYTPKEPVRLQGVTIMKLVAGLFLKPLGIARIQQANVKAWRLTKTKKVLLKPSLNLHMVTVDKNSSSLVPTYRNLQLSLNLTNVC